MYDPFYLTLGVLDLDFNFSKAFIICLNTFCCPAVSAYVNVIFVENIRVCLFLLLVKHETKIRYLFLKYKCLLKSRCLFMLALQQSYVMVSLVDVC